MREVENVEVTCLVDNNVDVLLPDTEVAHRPVLAENWYERPLIAEHGFSAAVTLEVNGRKHRLLLDSGLDPLAAAHNADMLGFDLTSCELVISSHGHIDHAGGLLSVRKKMNPGQRVPLVLHKDAFRNRMVKFQDGRKIINLPAPNRSLLAQAGYEIVEEQSHSLWIDGSVLVTGEIARSNNFEKGLPNHYSEVEEGGKMENDPLIKDDQAVILNVKDKGLVIITGCGHAGIINTLNYAKELTGEDRIYAVLGGMHLTGGLFEPIIPRTTDELEGLKPKFVVPCHCSGLKAVTQIARKMPDAFMQNSVGTNYTF
ncbi:Beta-lactamase domain protein [Nitrososphaera viennensis EN76]|uniref:Beta-lactamase domain protein n=1 Tax=Nitrososphaera viennensis EN76 TaxID=926571 RepID=A0A060HM77_9ARCH|nr:Beta-lactamase domain protein [Nitrososphaera viennensis EN76]